MRQSILQLILHQSTSNAIVGQVKRPEGLVRLEASNNDIDRFVSQLVPLKVKVLNLGIADCPDYLAYSLI